MATGSSCSTPSMPADQDIGDRIRSATSQRAQIRITAGSRLAESVSNTPSSAAGSSDDKAPDDADDDVCCTVCERFNHAAMFNIFKCFCLAQRLFLVAKLFQFRVCHVKSSYLCEHCLERLEVIEELELLKKEFVCNFIGRCKVDESLHNAESKNSNVSTESEQNSIICTPKRAQEPELMAISRLKRQMELMPEDKTVEKWRVDVLTTPNDLGGINHMNLAALPTIRKLFTANGQRRYWLLPPTSTDLMPVRSKKRRFSELVQYLKQQTASNALLASFRNSRGCVKVKRRNTSTTTEETGASSIKESSASDSCAANTKDLTNGDVTEPVESAKNVAPAQASASGPDDQAEPSKASPMSDQRTASSDDEDDDDDVMIIDEDDKSLTTTTRIPTCKMMQLSKNNRDVDPLFGMDDRSMIENVVESFLHFDDAERLAMVKSSEANMLDRVMEPELEPATVPVVPMRPKPRNSPAVNKRLKIGEVSVDVLGRPSATLRPLMSKPEQANTTRVAPTIRLVALKNALAAAMSTASTSSSANVSDREISIPIISSPKTVFNTSTMTGSTTGIVVYTGRTSSSSSSVQGQQVITPTVVTNAGTPPAPQQLTLVRSNSKQPLVFVGIGQGAVAYVSQSMVTTESQFPSSIDSQAAFK